MSKEHFRDFINKENQKVDTSFDRYFDTTYEKHDEYKKRFSILLNHVIGPRVIDIGCGPGVSCFLLSNVKDIHEIHGIDIQEKVLQEAKRNVTSEKVKFHLGFAENLSFPNEYFDTAILGETLEHVYSLEETISEIFRVLKKDGRVVITCPYRGKVSSLHIRSIDENTLKVNLQNKFKIVELKRILNGKYLYCFGVKL